MKGKEWCYVGYSCWQINGGQAIAADQLIKGRSAEEVAWRLSEMLLISPWLTLSTLVGWREQIVFFFFFCNVSLPSQLMDTLKIFINYLKQLISSTKISTFVIKYTKLFRSCCIKKIPSWLTQSVLTNWFYLLLNLLCSRYCFIFSLLSLQIILFWKCYAHLQIRKPKTQGACV